MPIIVSTYIPHLLHSIFIRNNMLFKKEYNHLFFCFFSVLFIYLILFCFVFSFIFINWRLITWQYCSGFCHTLTWISHGFTCILHPDFLLYNIVLVLPYFDMNPPWVYMCSEIIIHWFKNEYCKNTYLLEADNLIENSCLDLYTIFQETKVTRNRK